MQLIRHRHGRPDCSFEPLRRVLVLVPVRVSALAASDPTAIVLHEMGTGSGGQATVDIPHVFIEVPADRILEESRVMAQAVLADHSYDVAAATGFTHRPRMMTHEDLTVIVAPHLVAAVLTVALSLICPRARLWRRCPLVETVSRTSGMC